MSIWSKFKRAMPQFGGGLTDFLSNYQRAQSRKLLTPKAKGRARVLNTKAKREKYKMRRGSKRRLAMERARANTAKQLEAAERKLASYGGGYGGGAVVGRGTAVSGREAALDKQFNEMLAAIEAQLKRQENLQKELASLEITPSLASQFLAQATKELSPYYSELAGQAQKDLGRRAEFETTSHTASEAAMSRGYGQQLRGHGEEMAESGFALSGRRKRGEADLAKTTQEAVDERRRQLGYTMGAIGSEFERRYGSKALKGMEVPTISGMPTVRAGQESWEYGEGTKPLYKISGGLIGELEKEKGTEVTRRQRELEKSWRAKGEARLRRMYL